MKTSESLTKLAPALLKAQKAITFAEKAANNPFFKSKYADLPTVITAIKAPLNDNGIIYIQTATLGEGPNLYLVTRLLHESGEWIEDTACSPLQKQDPQSYGSAITYLRRYSLAAIAGLFQADDDGQYATHGDPRKPTENPQETPKFGPRGTVSTDTVKAISAMCADGTMGTIVDKSLEKLGLWQLDEMSEEQGQTLLKALTVKAAKTK